MITKEMQAENIFSLLNEDGPYTSAATDSAHFDPSKLAWN